MKYECKLAKKSARSPQETLAANFYSMMRPEQSRAREQEKSRESPRWELYGKSSSVIEDIFPGNFQFSKEIFIGNELSSYNMKKDQVKKNHNSSFQI